MATATATLTGGPSLDRLLDIAADMGGVRVTWGPANPTTRFPERCWVALVGMPDGRRAEHLGPTIESAAWALLHTEFPDPSDMPDEPA